jgi:hypothetical protein
MTAELERLVKYAPRIKTEDYRWGLDLRPDYPVVLFPNSCRDFDHKLSFTSTSNLDAQAIYDTTRSLFVCNPLDARVLRVDLAVDIPDVTVAWFRTHALVSHKSIYTDYRDSCHRIGGRVETLEFGKRPNLIKFYNKIAERLRSLNMYDKTVPF